MKPSTEINATIDYRKIGVHLKEARKGKVRSWLMPPVSSVLGNCVVCKEAGIKASPSAACASGTGRGGLGEK